MITGEQLLNRWIEYTGGSRPGTNFLRFSDIGERGILLEIKYIFDWETKEMVNHRFHLSRGEYTQLVEELLRTGHSIHESTHDDEELFFEWQMADDKRVHFRVRGESMADLRGKRGYNMTDFQELIVES